MRLLQEKSYYRVNLWISVIHRISCQLTVWEKIMEMTSCPADCCTGMGSGGNADFHVREGGEDC